MEEVKKKRVKKAKATLVVEIEHYDAIAVEALIKTLEQVAVKAIKAQYKEGDKVPTRKELWQYFADEAGADGSPVW